MKLLVMATPGEDWKMVCPYCEHEYVQHGRLIIVEREREDGASFQLDTAMHEPKWLPTEGNPSPRRNGFFIEFQGECGHEWALAISQHKGQTFINSYLVTDPDSDTNTLASMPYADYLKTEHWQQVRKSALARAEHRCQLCNAAENLNVHHRTYENRGAEKDSDVTVLCKPCHEQFHGVTNGQVTNQVR